uniref:hypothetical protein n=1 Tax=Candidatus Electronema sp. TaxID=2698783 RepID=UPI004055B100
MKKPLLKTALAAFAAAAVLSGCAASGIPHDFAKELVAHPRTYFSQVRTTAGADGFRVSGKVRLTASPNAGIPNTVEVALTDPAGRVIDTKKVSCTGLMNGSNRRHREGRFTALFSETPPIGTIVRVSNVN